MKAQSERPLRVLVADDHPTNRAVIEIILDLVSAAAVSVENGQQALMAFKTEEFDVVLMDLQMPVMDGLTAIREIRKHEIATDRRRTPVLAVTANALSEHVAASKEAGADRHIAKPVTPELLLAAISAELERARAVVDEVRAKVRKTGS
ncbi:MAG: response regulator [Phenylobacterium sp.]|nr:MAG: response regulator [Phenylobacterium sp.]